MIWNVFVEFWTFNRYVWIRSDRRTFLNVSLKCICVKIWFGKECECVLYRGKTLRLFPPAAVRSACAGWCSGAPTRSTWASARGTRAPAGARRWRPRAPTRRRSTARSRTTTSATPGCARCRPATSSTSAWYRYAHRTHRPDTAHALLLIPFPTDAFTHSLPSNRRSLFNPTSYWYFLTLRFFSVSFLFFHINSLNSTNLHIYIYTTQILCIAEIFFRIHMHKYFH